MVTFHTNHGDIVIKTFDDKAPETVKNFLDYCREGFYNNTIFHRVINGFMIQGGGFEPGMRQKETKEAIKNEANNGLKNTRGTLAMARTQAPHSATSLAKACKAGATAYSQKWLKAWTWSTRSKPFLLAAAVCTRTFLKKTL